MAGLYSRARLLVRIDQARAVVKLLENYFGVFLLTHPAFIWAV